MEACLTLLEQFSAVISQGQGVIQLDLQDRHLVIVLFIVNVGLVIRMNFDRAFISQDPDPPSSAFLVDRNLDLA